MQIPPQFNGLTWVHTL